MMFEKGMELRRGQMDQNTKGIIKQDKDMAKGLFYGLMDRIILVTLQTMSSREEECIVGLMEEDMRENGWIM